MAVAAACSGSKMTALGFRVELYSSHTTLAELIKIKETWRQFIVWKGWESQEMAVQGGMEVS